jgi:glycosyltransferase involved in cell wall biosynthesis
MAKICLVRQFYFPFDTRVRREVHALLDAGHEVDVICQQGDGEPAVEHSGRLSVRRLRVRRRRQSVVQYLLEYLEFFLKATALLAVRQLRRRYDLVQVNSLPDPLVFGAVIPRLTGTPVLLDLHECAPEFFATKFDMPPDRLPVRVLAWLEQASIRFASMVTTCTDQMRDTFVGRGAPPDKVVVVLNGSDEAVFDPGRFPHSSNGNGFELISHGSLEKRYGIDTVIEAVARVDDIPGLRLKVYGDGPQLEELEALTKVLGAEDRVWFSRGFVPLDELVAAIAAADAGVVAVERNPFRDLTLCNKMYDFIAMDKPAIVSRTRSVEEYFDESCFQLFDASDVDSLTAAIRELHADPSHGTGLAERAKQVAASHRWPRQREIYLDTVGGLLRRRSAARR